MIDAVYDRHKPTLRAKTKVIVEDEKQVTRLDKVEQML